MKFTIALIFLIALNDSSCRKTSPAELPFQDLTSQFPIPAGVVDEASGMADSYANAGSLWIIQDSGNPTELFLYSHTGGLVKKMFISNITNRDWEELAVAGGPAAGKKYVYIAETGDNNQQFADYAFYRFEEPVSSTDTITGFDKIQFRYPDGSHDSEAFFVDHATKDIYLITKRDAQSKVYKLPFPQSTTGMNTAVFVTNLPYSGVVAASYSVERELLVKTYSNIYYYRLTGSDSIFPLLASRATTLLYQQEPQGEAVALANDNAGFYTLSEKAFAASVSLNFYRRK